MAYLELKGLWVIAMLTMFICKAGAFPSMGEACITGCRIDSEDSYGSLWAAQRYNYTVAIVLLVVYQQKGVTSTAATIAVADPTAAFHIASRSIVALREFHHGVLVVNGEATSMFGTTLRYPSSDLRVAKFTAFSTFQTTSAECVTTSNTYIRDPSNLWEPLGQADEKWLKTTKGQCNPCPSGRDWEVGTRLGDMPSRIYAVVPGLGACSTATMDDEPVTKVALVPVTLTTVEFVQ